MFHRLRGSDKRSVEILLVNVSGHLFHFLKDSVDGRAVDRLGLDAMHFEYLLHAFDMFFRLGQMKVEPAL
jgi:hypothetical protein